MKEVAIVLGVVAVGVGGYCGWRWWKKRREDEARLASARAGGVDAAAAAVQRAPTIGEAIAELGGRAVSEGAKYFLLGSSGYAAAATTRVQRAS